MKYPTPLHAQAPNGQTGKPEKVFYRYGRGSLTRKGRGGGVRHVKKLVRGVHLGPKQAGQLWVGFVCILRPFLTAPEAILNFIPFCTPWTPFTSSGVYEEKAKRQKSLFGPLSGQIWEH